MPTIKIEQGKIFGDFVVIERDYNHPTSGAAYWICECNKCHRQKSIRADNIRKNPGCRCGASVQLINTIINDFKILGISNEKAPDKSIMLICQCIKCGYIEHIASNVLRSNRHHCPKCYIPKTTLIDMTGQTYNFLTVLQRDMGEDHIGHEADSYWICKCNNCGTIRSFRGIDVREGRTKSCGCIKSHGEEEIAKILLNNDIIFQREYSFPDLIYKQPLRFDFAIFNSNGQLSHLVEYDGIQHFQYRDSGWNTEENFKQLKIRDELKDTYCKDKKIKLIRIKYFEEITLERIMGDAINSSSNGRTKCCS